MCACVELSGGLELVLSMCSLQQVLRSRDIECAVRCIRLGILVVQSWR